MSENFSCSMVETKTKTNVSFIILASKYFLDAFERIEKKKDNDAIIKYSSCAMTVASHNRNIHTKLFIVYSFCPLSSRRFSPFSVKPQAFILFISITLYFALFLLMAGLCCIVHPCQIQCRQKLLLLFGILFILPKCELHIFSRYFGQFNSMNLVHWSRILALKQLLQLFAHQHNTIIALNLPANAKYR